MSWIRTAARKLASLVERSFAVGCNAALGGTGVGSGVGVASGRGVGTTTTTGVLVAASGAAAPGAAWPAVVISLAAALSCGDESVADVVADVVADMVGAEDALDAGVAAEDALDAGVAAEDGSGAELVASAPWPALAGGAVAAVASDEAGALVCAAMGVQAVSAASATIAAPRTDRPVIRELRRSQPEGIANMKGPPFWSE
jgi:hypothetical protein